MKKSILALSLLVATSAFANPHHRHNNHGHWQRSHGSWEWVVPAIIGGVIVYEATRPSQQVIIQQPAQHNCSPWTEIQNPDGTITRTRTCY